MENVDVLVSIYASACMSQVQVTVSDQMLLHGWPKWLWGYRKMVSVGKCLLNSGNELFWHACSGDVGPLHEGRREWYGADVTVKPS